MLKPSHLPQEVRGDPDHLGLVAQLLAIGLRRALARPHNWNESVNSGESTNPVALEDQSVISAVAPANGAEEDA